MIASNPKLGHRIRQQIGDLAGLPVESAVNLGVDDPCGRPVRAPGRGKKVGVSKKLFKEKFRLVSAVRFQNRPGAGFPL